MKARRNVVSLTRNENVRGKKNGFSSFLPLFLSFSLLQFSFSKFFPSITKIEMGRREKKEEEREKEERKRKKER